jgi:hypothetical protein
VVTALYTPHLLLKMFVLYRYIMGTQQIMEFLLARMNASMKEQMQEMTARMNAN